MYEAIFTMFQVVRSTETPLRKAPSRAIIRLELILDEMKKAYLAVYDEAK